MLDPTTDPDYEVIPALTLDAIHRYVMDGIPPGEFIVAMLSNDLLGVCSRADEHNAKAIIQIHKYLFNQTPCGCWGHPERVHQWINDGGLRPTLPRTHTLKNHD